MCRLDLSVLARGNLSEYREGTHFVFETECTGKTKAYADARGAPGMWSRKPLAGNPHGRFDEGDEGHTFWVSPHLYSTPGHAGVVFGALEAYLFQESGRR